MMAGRAAGSPATATLISWYEVRPGQEPVQAALVHLHGRQRDVVAIDHTGDDIGATQLAHLLAGDSARVDVYGEYVWHRQLAP